MAARVLDVAIHELLLAQAAQRAGGDGVGTLNSACDGECPARAALPLVLHWADGVLGPPIDGRWDSPRVHPGQLLCHRRPLHRRPVPKQRAELIGAEVSVLVHPAAEGLQACVCLRIVGADKCDGVLKMASAAGLQRGGVVGGVEAPPKRELELVIADHLRQVAGVGGCGGGASDGEQRQQQRGHLSLAPEFTYTARGRYSSTT